MGLTTTGSLVNGLVRGLPAHGLNAGGTTLQNGSVYGLPELTTGIGNPNNLLTAVAGSQVFYDVKNSELYCALYISGTTYENTSGYANGGGGSTWIHLGSVQ